MAAGTGVGAEVYVVELDEYRQRGWKLIFRCIDGVGTAVESCQLGNVVPNLCDRIVMQGIENAD